MPSNPDVLAAEAAPGPFHTAIARAEVGQQRVIVTRKGKPVAALVPISDLEAIEDAEDATVAAERSAKWEAAGRPHGTTLEDLAARWSIDLSDLEA